MKKFLGITTAIIVLILVFFFYWRYYYTYSDGNRTGLLQKFSHKGNLFKTYEGELVLSSIQSTGGVGIASEKGDLLGQMKLSSRAKTQSVKRDATALLTAFGLALRSFD